MDDLKIIKEKFEENLKLVDQIVNIGSDVGGLVVSILENLKTQYEKMPAFLEYKNKLDTIIETIKNIKNHSSLIAKYQVIYNQALVLLVENFESFLNDLTKSIIDKYPHLIKWPEKKNKLHVDVTLLRYSNPTVGDLVLNSLRGEVNFQDLQATLRFLREYFELDIDLLEKEKNLIILGQALRNIIIHNNSKVDHAFLNQIRDIKSHNYTDKKSIKLTHDEYMSFRETFFNFSQKIINKITKNKLKSNKYDTKIYRSHSFNN